MYIIRVLVAVLLLRHAQQLYLLPVTLHVPATTDSVSYVECDHDTAVVYIITAVRTDIRNMR